MRRICGTAGGIYHLLQSDASGAVVAFVFIVYLEARVVATCVKAIEGSSFFWRGFLLHPESALDVQMFRMRKMKQIPRLLIKTREGQELKGSCLAYTFTEPREVLLEITDEEGNTRLVWCRIDATVSHIEIYPKGKENERNRKIVSLLPRW